LWLLTAEPEILPRLRDVVFSLALRYGGIAARDGIVRGIKYPFYGRPLVSASAHLASGLWRSGIYPTVIPPLVSFVAESIGPDAGWADEGQPSDVLTTLAAADLLARLDPGFDPTATISWFERHQEKAGWWRALNPEVPWLTAAVVAWLQMADQPFPARFAWPSSPIWSRDRLSGLTTMAMLDELESILTRLPRLGDEPLEVAFLDLARFGDWNTSHGQAMGDEVIRVLGASLRAMSDVLAIRIGGDEILLIGKPGADRGRLEATLDTWRYQWPQHLSKIGAANIAPRILVAAGRASELGSIRRGLGDAISSLKKDQPDPSPQGVIRRLGGATAV
jgi:GGDEF domain-containing protein